MSNLNRSINNNDLLSFLRNKANQVRPRKTLKKHVITDQVSLPSEDRAPFDPVQMRSIQLRAPPSESNQEANNEIENLRQKTR